ncbi:ubiquitin carboxyl-terminal hydrolase [Striga asiatica]|uniref:ubiquitinyl hydrolase 1 n=1 Tax=Striga asiatica TaxID=4170 RepID=A0A5A7PLJ4_STRAF|nr:ubiquitin carboxyl-terminal hydrolase [Striga asiatica]
MADHNRKRATEEFVTYSYILLYIALSSGQIFFNKWVLSSKEMNFPYPLGLTLLHMVFSSVLCFMLTKVFKIMKVDQGMTMDIYITSVIPIGAMFAMTLWLGNTAYLYISVAFAQMLKAIMPVAVFILGVLAGLEVMSGSMLLIMSVISFGVLVASYGEIEINWIGVVYQMGGVVGEALRLIFMEIFVKRKGLKLNPISVIALCLLIPWIFLEKPKMDAQGTWSFKPLMLVLNSLCTFALNLSVFLVISHTSALTIRVAGVVKDWVVVLLSALLFADTKLTLINLFGYAIVIDQNSGLSTAIAGVAAYNNHKLKKEASRNSSAPRFYVVRKRNNQDITTSENHKVLALPGDLRREPYQGGGAPGDGPHRRPRITQFSNLSEEELEVTYLGVKGGTGTGRLENVAAEMERTYNRRRERKKHRAGDAISAVEAGRWCGVEQPLMAMLQMTWQPTLLRSLKRKYGSPPLGLRNLGNTCYLNSVLQCLTYTPPLANFCLRFFHSSVCDSKKEKRECAFCILERRIALSLNSEAVVDAPLKINRCLRIYAEHFRAGRQEDAHEFLRYVIDACHNTCLRLKKLQQQQQRGKTGAANGGDISGSTETVVKEIFGGELQSQVKCLSCGAESNKIDDIMDISLDILHSGSLKEALQKFFQPEVLDGNNKYKCDSCERLVAARKQMTILQAPNVLVIQLKRFEGLFGGKVDKPIAFDEALVLSSHMCKGSKVRDENIAEVRQICIVIFFSFSESDQYPEYGLFGTIVHSGFSPDSGHYYAYIKDATGRWFCCNDSYVSVSTLQEVLSEKVYMLFFSRTKQRSHARVDIVSGNKTHKSNGSAAYIKQKSGCPDNSTCTKLVSSQQQETCSSTNGTDSSTRESSHPEKPVKTKLLTSNSESNGHTDSLATNGTKTTTHRRSELVETPASVNKRVNNFLEGQNSISSVVSKSSNTIEQLRPGSHVKPVNNKETSNHHGQTNNTMKFEVDQRLPLVDGRLSDSLIGKKLLAAGNSQFIVREKESSKENSCTEALITSGQMEKTGLPMIERNGMCQTLADIEITKKGPSLCISNGEAGHTAVDSERRISEGNGPRIITAPCKNLNGIQNEEIVGSDNSSMKRKMGNGLSCIFLARDDESRGKVEAFKEVIGKEASVFLRSCGWSDEVQKFMHARKKMCQEAGNAALDDSEMKNLLISQAKRNFIPKVPETLKATLIKRIKLFSQENRSSGTLDKI